MSRERMWTIASASPVTVRSYCAPTATSRPRPKGLSRRGAAGGLSELRKVPVYARFLVEREDPAAQEAAAA